MTPEVLPAPAPLHHRLKTFSGKVPISSEGDSFPDRPTSPSATARPATLTAPATSPPILRPRTVTSHSSRRASPAPDKAVAAFVRRVLCGHHAALTPITGGPASGISSQLPPLTSSNAVDLELYALLASLVRDYVQPWYSKITPDRTFHDELVLLIAHISRAMEERARKVDWTLLLFDTLPHLATAHVDAYRIACRAGSIDGNAYQAANLSTIFHTLRSHPALRSEQADQAYRYTLASTLLSHFLPHHDAENPCFRSFVDALCADLLLGFILARLCEPSFALGAIQRAARNLQIRMGTNTWTGSESPVTVDINDDLRSEDTAKLDETPRDSFGESTRLAQYGLVPKEDPILKNDVVTKVASGVSSELEIFRPLQIILYYINLLWATVYGLITSIAAASSLPTRVAIPQKTTTPTSPPGGKPLYTYGLCTFVRHLLYLDARLPWLSTIHSLLARAETTKMPWLNFGLLGFDGRVDRLIAHHVLAPMADPSQVPQMLNALRLAIFLREPTLPAQTVQPTRAESRRAAACALLDCMPYQGALLLFGPIPDDVATSGNEAVVDVLSENLATRVLDPFVSDAEITRSLVYSVVELVVAALVPEMARQADEHSLHGPAEGSGVMTNRVGSS